MSPTYPMLSAGPAVPVRPLCTDLLQIIPGDVRLQTPPVSILPPSIIKPALHLEARHGAHSASIHLNAQSGAIPDYLFHFDIPDHAPAHIAFKLSQTATADPTSPVLSPPLHAIVPLAKLTCKGVHCLPLQDGYGSTVAHLTVDHMLIQVHNGAADEPPRKVMPPPRWVGHRGQGSSDSAFPHRLLENSLESYLSVALPDGPCKTVELDVQLSKDGKTIMYHDWFLRHGTGNAQRKTALFDMTFQQFDEAFREKHARQEVEQLPETNRLLQELVAKGNNVRAGAFGYHALTLRDVCEALPEHIGIMVEVKYPAPNVQKEKCLTYAERNEIADVVLDDILAVKRNENRYIVFLSFEPDICNMLAWKQVAFPVYLLHCDQLSKPCDDADPRCTVFGQGVRYAAALGLEGMVVLSSVLADFPTAVREVKEHGLLLMTYGDLNMDPAFVQTQFEWGVNGIITDDVDVVFEAHMAQGCF